MKKICFVVSSPMSAISFLSSHLNALQSDYEITLVANTADSGVMRHYGVDIDITPVLIERKVRLLKDLLALLALIRLFKRGGFHLVHSLSPKAGLLAMLAAWITRIPVRVHWFTGQVWLTKSGLSRWGLRLGDKLVASLATHVLVDSHSQRDFLIKERLIHETSSEVLAHGSVSGVDTGRFQPSDQRKSIVRAQLGIPGEDLVLLYLGRLNEDKGISDLAFAFRRLAGRLPKLWLLVVGPDEQDMLGKIGHICAPCRERVRQVDFTDEPESYMAASDIFCLPSYREGFGSSVIEASSCGLPTVASRIYGLIDAVSDGETGFLFETGDISALSDLIEYLATNSEIRRKMGLKSRQRVLEHYRQEIITDAMKKFLKRIL